MSPDSQWLEAQLIDAPLIAIVFTSINVTDGESSGRCPSCDDPISDGEWQRFGVCTACHAA
jgi:hypothetical protein